MDKSSKTIIPKFENINTKVIFTPEHGLSSNYEAGEHILNDNSYNIPIVSLYGNSFTPDTAYLSNLDAIIFDIQDIWSRYYTYVSTMTYMMKMCAELGIKFYVLDRPNPISGINNGPILDKNFSSFVGMHEIQIRHGMTIGELAYMINEEDWLSDEKKVDLYIIKMQGWNRSMYYDETGLLFNPPSPNIPDLETAILYSGLCLIEGTNLSEGRGTEFPFKQIGAPWLDASALLKQLNTYNHNGIKVEEVSFTPKSIPGKSKFPKYENVTCEGIKISILIKIKQNP